MSRPREIEIEKDGVKGACLPSALKAWKRNGWTVVDDEDSEVEPAEVVVAPTVEVVPDLATDETKEN